MKKGISLIILVITILVIFVFSTIVIKNGIDMRIDVNYIRLEKEIEMIEKAVRKAKLKNETYGTELNIKIKTETNYDNLAKYKKIKDYLNTNHNISTYYEDYMVLEKEDLQKMNIDNIQGTYVVNYDRGFVFTVDPIIVEEEKIYTTQDIGLVDESVTYTYYLEYDPSVGVVPSETGNWERRSYAYSFMTQSGGKLFSYEEMGTEEYKYFKTYSAGHIYQRLSYVPKDHLYAENSMIEITYNNFSGEHLSMLLSDEEKSAQCAWNTTSFMVLQHKATSTVPIHFTLSDSKMKEILASNTNVTVRIEKIRDKALYFINGNLIYAQIGLFDKSAIGTAIPTGFVPEVGYTAATDKANSFSVCISSAEILNAKYAEW